MTKHTNSYRQRRNSEIRKIDRGQARRVIDTRLPPGLFYVRETGAYVGIDNSNGQAWTEEFPNLKRCKRWLRNPNIESGGNFMSGENNSTNRNIFDSLQEEIMRSDLPEAEKNRRLSALLRASSRRINLLLVGGSGVGKSSTINALFDMSVAKVGIGVDPETKDIQKFDLGNLTVWDTPGLGDTVDNDKHYTNQIVRKLSEKGRDGKLLIDLVLVVLDASSKDMSVSYDVINNTLIPCLGKETNRILIALNQSDLAMKGRHWNCELNAPNPLLQDFLIQKTESVQRRIYEATGVTVNPVCYCAGYTDGSTKQNPYNLSKLLYYILMAVPANKRLVLADKLNGTETNWTCNDKEKDYTEAIKKSFWESLWDDILAGVAKGADYGRCVIDVPGMIIGGLVGAVIGGLHSLIIKPFVNLWS